VGGAFERREVVLRPPPLGKLEHADEMSRNP
jgi:hypothetical protein